MPQLKDIVRSARLERGLTMTEFAAAVGLSQGAVACLEYGGRATLPTIERLASFLQRPVNELDPDGYAIKRRVTDPRSRRVRPARPPEMDRLLDRFMLLHASFNIAHERVVAAVRADDMVALAAARQRQARVLEEQGALIDAYVAARRRVPIAGPRESERATALTVAAPDSGATA
jgi:transcriptional regulator with XRE-family HTH domain